MLHLFNNQDEFKKEVIAIQFGKTSIHVTYSHQETGYYTINFKYPDSEHGSFVIGMISDQLIPKLTSLRDQMLQNPNRGTIKIGKSEISYYQFMYRPRPDDGPAHFRWRLCTDYAAEMNGFDVENLDEFREFLDAAIKLHEQK